MLEVQDSGDGEGEMMTKAPILDFGLPIRLECIRLALIGNFDKSVECVIKRAVRYEKFIKGGSD